MGRKTSIVWNYFTIPALYPKKALCNYCRQLVCRGQTNLGTTSLMNHLKRCDEFKFAVLGIPKGINQVMAAIMSASDNQNGRSDEQDELVDVVEIPTPDVEVKEAAQESSWKGTTDSAPMHFIPRLDESPSFVGRQPICPTSHKPAREYQSNERSSALLYGDITSTSEPVEEPSSSSTTVNTSLCPAYNDLMSYASSKSTVDFMYGGLVLHMMYQQYKAGKYCDMHIIPQKISNEVTISETGKVTKKTFSSEKMDMQISAHSSLLAALSRKVNSFLEMGCSTIQLKKGGSESVRGLMEIVYTGKLEKIRTYSEKQLVEILEVARFLEVDYAVQYLMSEIPEGKVKPKNNVERLIHDRLISLNTTGQRDFPRNAPTSTAVASESSSVISAPSPRFADKALVPAFILPGSKRPASQQDVSSQGSEYAADRGRALVEFPKPLPENVGVKKIKLEETVDKSDHGEGADFISIPSGHQN